MMDYSYLTAANAIRLTTLIASTGIFVSMLEELYAFNHYRENGLLNWNVSRLRQKWTSSRLIGHVLDPIFCTRGYRLLLLYLLISSGLMSLTFVVEKLLFPISVMILVGLVFINIRNLYGNDGSDHMNLVIFSSAVIYGAVPDGSLAQQASIWFIAIQYTLSLAIAGFAKLASPIWRSGQALIGIMSMKTYGNPRLYSIIRNRRNLSKVLCWLIISIQCIFWLVFFVNSQVVIAFLIIGFIFHLSISIAMGLNNFSWAFLSTYPVVWFCAQQLK